MNTVYVTFDYTGISDPDTCKELQGTPAKHQFRIELAEAMENYGDDLVGWRVCSWHVNHLCVVALTLTSDMTPAERVAHLQTVLFDEGGLSGEFTIGRMQPYIVEHIVSEVVWAVSDAHARELAAHRFERVATVNVALT